MEMQHLYDIVSKPNILEIYDLPHTFFTDPEKALDEETCLHEIIHILVHEKLHFPVDSSDFSEMIDSKSGESIQFPQVEIESMRVKPPFLKNINSTDPMNPLINLLCFMRAYASHTYTHKGSFRLYFIDVFNVFYGYRS
jgi:hypothetical protein